MQFQEIHQKRHQKVAQREQKGTQREPKGSQREPKGSQKRAKARPKCIKKSMSVFKWILAPKMVPFWTLENSDGVQKRPKKTNMATFRRPKAAWRLQKVVFERVQKSIEILIEI